ncbi:regulatory protein RecX [Nesterenkonia alba]|uniref:regulatory protein RecX n=1 Tax=Nesterenkonia alba TaxID=515814 RepID=UPI0003B369C9|nr:regulatory protein RecX [Nesterenkonia alba]
MSETRSHTPGAPPTTSDVPGEKEATLAALRDSLAKLESGAETSVGSTASSTTGEEATDEYSQARNIVLRKLTGSAKSRHQLAEALRDKEISEQTIHAVLDRMEDVQLVDDAAFARTWVRTRHELKGLGTAALRQELKHKGVAAETIEAALDQLTAEDEDAAARDLVEAKLRGVDVPPGADPEARREREKITRRLVGMLGRRGHSPAVAFRIVTQALEERTAT